MAASRATLSTSKITNLLSCLRLKEAHLQSRICVMNCRYASTNERPARPSNRAIPDEVDQWKKLDWRAYATGRVRVPLDDDEPFAALLIPGHSPLPHKLEKRQRAVRRPLKRKPARSLGMPTDQDWTSVWPAAETFKWSVVPLPVRQGYIKKRQNDGIPPGKYGNVELMKIPNFLHLTPGHVKKQCAAIKQFCTEWPKGLETDEACDKHFPLEVITRDYVADSPSIRDPRARLVTVKFRLSDLTLDSHARDKMLKLVGDRYNQKTDIVTLEADRCPVKQQNYDYIVYLMTALYHESWKTEDWETTQHEDDMLSYEWDITAARDAMIKTVQRIKETEQHGTTPSDKLSSPLSSLPPFPAEADIEALPAVQEYREALCRIHHEGDDTHHQEMYKQATKKLLLGI